MIILIKGKIYFWRAVLAIFRDRYEAGERLSEVIELPKGSVIFAIPRGGVPVGAAIAEHHGLPFDVIVVRKLPIPWNPEAGFGAISPDGGIVLNPHLSSYLSDEEIERISNDVLREVERRNLVYRGGKGYRDLTGRVAVVVDDGFASGYTAIAAAKFLRKLNPEALLAVAPVCPPRTKDLLFEYFDDVFCLVEDEGLPFAVASFYEDFHDLRDEEVISLIERMKRLGLWWGG